VDAQADLKNDPTTDPEIDTRTPAEPDAGKRQAELARLLERAELGDKAVLPMLRQYLDEHPAIWQEYGDLAQHAEATIGLEICGCDLLLGECIRRKLKALKAELGGASAAERLLAERVALSWLEGHLYDRLMAQARKAGAAGLRALPDLQDRAHRRHLAALKALATVRKLLTPAPSPIDVATRLGRPGAASRGGCERMAGRVPIRN
jgi:hypothetical protein